MMSQQKMLGKPVSKDARPLPLYVTFQKQREQAEAWLKSQPNIQVLKLNYAQVIENPEECAELVHAFIGDELNVEAMVASVDKNLYRNK
jgi:hypothetical protein